MGPIDCPLLPDGIVVLVDTVLLLMNIPLEEVTLVAIIFPEIVSVPVVGVTVSVVWLI
jgi:hypothetical protein